MRTSSLLLCLLLAGCGQKGPLYLPVTPAAPAPAPAAEPATAPAPDSDSTAAPTAPAE